METVKNFLIGGTGVAGVELASNIDPPGSTDTPEIIKVLIQIVIGIATLIGLFKKKRKN